MKASRETTRLPSHHRIPDNQSQQSPRVSHAAFSRNPTQKELRIAMETDREIRANHERDPHTTKQRLVPGPLPNLMALR